MWIMLRKKLCSVPQNSSNAFLFAEDTFQEWESIYCMKFGIGWCPIKFAGHNNSGSCSCKKRLKLSIAILYMLIINFFCKYKKVSFFNVYKSHYARKKRGGGILEIDTCEQGSRWVQKLTLFCGRHTWMLPNILFWLLTWQKHWYDFRLKNIVLVIPQIKFRLTRQIFLPPKFLPLRYYKFERSYTEITPSPYYPCGSAFSA